tara:strand:+ start:1048 stop:1356 length:309 start_codon:yes stop_codon:yes gene_type:complete
VRSLRLESATQLVRPHRSPSLQPALTIVPHAFVLRAADGFTPIHRACWGGEKRHTDTVKAFLEAGVPHNQHAKNGLTPLRMVKGNKATTALLKDWAQKDKEL